jgi:hypothetical protein
MVLKPIWVCNECGELITMVAISDVEKVLAQFLAQQDFCTARCPHCAALNIFPGFSSIETFVCSWCRKVISVGTAVQSDAVHHSRLAGYRLRVLVIY